MVRPRMDGLGSLALIASTITHHASTIALPIRTSPVYPTHRGIDDFSFIDFLGPALTTDSSKLDCR